MKWKDGISDFEITENYDRRHGKEREIESELDSQLLHAALSLLETADLTPSSLCGSFNQRRIPPPLAYDEKEALMQFMCEDLKHEEGCTGDFHLFL